jgi:2-polyprenyl-3-methyl-5-hydroxy-6-metoxy-1,4-benzoquinol methylase
MRPRSRILTERWRKSELMDQPGLDPAEHSQALRGLARINWLSRSDAILWPQLDRLARKVDGRTIRVLDLASGGGDVAIALAKRANQAGLDISVEGCDISPEAVRFARAQAAQQGLSSRFFNLDVLNELIPTGYDVMTCSLFLHHLDEANAIGFLRKSAEAAGRLLLVNDLVRDPLGYALAWTGCRLLSRSRVVRHDGPASVAGAFTLAEVRELAKRAGLAGVSLSRRWPRRFLLSWSR